MDDSSVFMLGIKTFLDSDAFNLSSGKNSNYVDVILVTKDYLVRLK